MDLRRNEHAPAALLRRLRNRLRDHGPAQGVEPDPNLTNSRVTGGVGSDIGDAGPTTGTGPTGEYVGRIAGRDEGFAGETGAEVRAEGGPDESSRGERSG